MGPDGTYFYGSRESIGGVTNVSWRYIESFDTVFNSRRRGIHFSEKMRSQGSVVVHQDPGKDDISSINQTDELVVEADKLK